MKALGKKRNPAIAALVAEFHQSGASQPQRGAGISRLSLTATDCFSR
jgi:hypothetical protein